MRSFLGVPVMAGGAVFGNLYLTERAEGEFTEEDEQVATLLAAQAGVAIQNARLYARMNEHAEALRRALSDLSSVSVINESILSGQPRERVLTVIAERAAESLGVRLVAVAVPDAAGADRPTLPQQVPDMPTSIGTPVAPDSTTETVLLARRSVTIEDPEAGDELGARTAVFVPLLHRGDALGVIAAADPLDGRQFDGDDLGVLGLFAARSVLALEVSRGSRASGAGSRRRGGWPRPNGEARLGGR